MSRDIVVKGNQFIEASYHLSKTEMRLILKMISLIRKDDDDFRDYRFSVRQLLDEFSMHPNDHKEIEKATAGLIGKVIQIRHPKEERKLQVSFLSSAEYHEGVVELRFDPKLKPYLLQLRENFTMFYLPVIQKLKSQYAIRIYELSKQYQKLGFREIGVVELRGILGITKGQYQRYGHFKSRILAPSLVDINENTDLDVQMEEVKRGRRIETLAFHICSSTANELKKLAESKRMT